MDALILDKAAIHHGEAEEILERVYGLIDCFVFFLPRYHPMLNGAAYLFSWIKCNLDQVLTEPMT